MQPDIDKIQAQIDQLQRDLKNLESANPEAMPRASAQPPQPVGPPPNKSTISGTVNPGQNAPTSSPTPGKSPPAPQPVGPPASKSTVSGTVNPAQNAPTPTPAKPPPVPQPTETPAAKTVREVLEQQQNPTPPPTSGSPPSGGQPTGGPATGQKAGGVRLDVKSQGKTEDLDRNDVLKLLRKPGT